MSRTAASSEFRSWQRGVERVPRRIFAVITIAHLASIAWTLIRHGGGSTHAVLGLIALVLAFVAVRAWRDQISVLDNLLLIALLTSLVVINPSSTDGATGPDSFIGFTLFQLVIGCSVLTSTRRQHVALTILTLGLYAIGRGVHEGLNGLVAAFDEAFLISATAAGLFMILTAARAAAVRADEAHRGAIAERETKAAEEARERVDRDRQRVLHDEVIAALRLIDLPVADEARQSSCGSASEALRTGLLSSPPHRSLRESLEDMDKDLPIMVSVDFDARMDAIPVPSRVIRNLTEAVGEALRNVSLHAGTDSARVTVRTLGSSGVDIRVIDDGHGFENRAAGFGIANSIRARLAEISGSAQIRSAPGSGTTVQLLWSPVRRASTTQTVVPFYAMQSLFDDLPKFMLVLGALLWSGHAYLALRYATQSDHVAANLVAAAIATIVQLSVIVRLSRAPVSSTWLLAAFFAMGSALSYGLLVSGEGSLRGFDSWIVGMFEPPLMIMALVISAPVSLLVATAMSGIVFLFAVIDPTVRPLEVPNPIVELLALTAVAAAAAVGIRRIRGVAVSDENAIIANAELAIESRIRHDVTRQSIRALSSTLIPFFDAIVKDPSSANQEAVRNRAHILCLQARDELYLPDLFDAELRELIADRRSRGCSIVIRNWESPPNGGVSMAVLRGLLSELEYPTSVVVTFSSGTARHARMTIEPPLTELMTTRLNSKWSTLSERVEVNHDESVSVLTVS